MKLYRTRHRTEGVGSPAGHAFDTLVAYPEPPVPGARILGQPHWEGTGVVWVTWVVDQQDGSSG